MNNEKNYNYTNSLIKAASPYLLQHAHNPVDWNEWNESIWLKAKTENKLVLVSIGYSACHWCHVMEHECFENEETALIMNHHLINIKVDREERPDIDQIYMDACQLITGRGGWPLNVICLPNGKPIHAGTYFPKKHWDDLITQLGLFYKQNPEKANEYADKLTQGISTLETKQFSYNTNELIETKIIYQTLQKSFDITYGGLNYSPKFPMPPLWNFVLNYHSHTCDENAKIQLYQTLKKMSLGGIYDQIGGGFSRYSVDEQWKVPHFEKMLYDNAQLMELFSKSYILYKEPLFKDIIEGIYHFINTELMSSNDLFYSALDADSEGVEGKYYIWNSEEIKTILGSDSKNFIQYFEIDQLGLWEDNQNILLAKYTTEEFCQLNQLNHDEFKLSLQQSKSKLLSVREHRVSPSLDDKIIVSWNCLMIKGLVYAYRSTQEDKYLQLAENCLSSIISISLKENLELFRIIKNSKISIPAFLEDYSFLIDAMIELYQINGQEYLLLKSKELSQFVIDHFYDKETGFFFFKSKNEPDLIVKKYDTTDDVIPSANASMMTNLYKLGHYFDQQEWIEIAIQAVLKINNNFKRFPTGYSYWLQLQLLIENELSQLIFTGKANDLNLSTYILPHVIIGYATNETEIPLCKNKSKQKQKDVYYICKGKTCFSPVQDLKVAIQLTF